MDYALHERLAGIPFEEGLARVRAALQAEGFGIPVEMDTQSVF